MGSDHRGFELKEKIKSLLTGKGHEIIDVGCTGTESVDYPDYAFPAAEMVATGEVERAIVICGTGIGMSIAANKVKGVRAALCSTIDDAVMTRRHNDSNVLALSGDRSNDPAVEEIVLQWIATPFDGGRHKRRIDKISEYERNR